MANVKDFESQFPECLTEHGWQTGPDTGNQILNCENTPPKSIPENSEMKE